MNRPPPRGNVHPLSTPPHILPDTQKGAPLTELLLREMLPFQSPQISLKIPSQQTPQVPQRAPTETGTHLRNFLLPHPSKSLVNEPFPPRSPTGSLWREISLISRVNGLFIHLYLSGPQYADQRWTAVCSL